jgi:transposase
MTMDDRTDAKAKALKEYGALNLRAEDVTDELFCQNEFFDPQDLVLVKYEMLRRVRVDGQSVTQAAQAFGFSRVAFYQAKAAFEKDGLAGLIPKRRGPRHAHKLSGIILQFIDQQRSTDKTVRAAALAAMIRKRFHLSIHPRSIERALQRRQKKGR